MGITNLWPSLKLAFDERITLERFVSEFITTNNRCPSVAIDAYIFLFQQSIDDAIPANSFMAKIFYLLSLNIKLIVVFDGRFKPAKLRNEKLLDPQPSFQFNVDLFKNSSQHGYDEDIPLINHIKSLLVHYKIDYLQAPGEAEAQCAWLQKHNIVDYIISNDSDSLIFGATHILRNFNRYEDDISGSPKKNQVAPKSKYYVTPVHLSKITQIYGLDTKRLIFLATLKGGDYSSGVEKIGISNATKLALCGTDFIKLQNYSKVAMKQLNLMKNDKDFINIPDFATMALNCFIKPTCENLIRTHTHAYDETERGTRLHKVNTLINETVKAKSRIIFNRLFNNELIIDGDLMLLYLFPTVSPYVYKMLPCSISGQISATNDIGIPQEYHDRFAEAKCDQLTRINNVISQEDNVIGYLHLEYSNLHGKLQITYQEFIPQEGVDILQPYKITPEFDFYVKYIIIKLIAQKIIEGINIEDILYISNVKIEENIEMAMMKYDTRKLYSLFPNCIENKRKGGIDVSLKNYVWLPMNLIRLVNSDFVKQYEDSLARAKAGQSTTLDSFGAFPKSPTKVSSGKSPRRSKGSANNRRSMSGSPPKMSPLKRSPLKRKPTILPGQSFLDAFLTTDDPFIDNKSKYTDDQVSRKLQWTTLSPTKNPERSPTKRQADSIIESPTKRRGRDARNSSQSNIAKLDFIPKLSTRSTPIEVISLVSDSSDDNS